MVKTRKYVLKKSYFNKKENKIKLKREKSVCKGGSKKEKKPT